MLPAFRLLGMTDNQHPRILELRSSFCLSVIDGENEKNDRRDAGTGSCLCATTGAEPVFAEVMDR
jgi:hypothetical protein